MSQPPEAVTTSDLPQEAAEPQNEGWKLVQVAPGPEVPDTHDKSARRRGMILVLVGGALFWAAVAGVVAFMRSGN